MVRVLLGANCVCVGGCAAPCSIMLSRCSSTAPATRILRSTPELKARCRPSIMVMNELRLYRLSLSYLLALPLARALRSF